jgi:acyl carrier protein
MTEPSTARAVDDRSDDDVRSIVRDVIRELAPNPTGDHGPTTMLVEDLGFHSLALLELAFSLEDEFDLDPIDEPTARRITTTQDVENIVLEKLAERAAG